MTETCENFFETVGMIGVDIGPGSMKFYVAKELFMSSLEIIKNELIAAKASFAELEAELQRRQQVVEQEIAGLQEKFRNENAELILNAQLAAQVVADRNAELRKAIAAEYEVNRAEVVAAGGDPSMASKQLGYGLSVRVVEKLDYPMDRAVGWAKVNAPYMIRETVDAEIFVATMKALGAGMPDFVEVERKVTPVVSGV